MFDKSQLEKDIEQRELVRRPAMFFVLIAILFVCLGFLGAYTWKLQQELLGKEQEIVSLKNGFYQEKTEIQSIVRKLEKENAALKDKADSRSPVSSSATGKKKESVK